MPGKGKNFNPYGVIFGPKPPCGKDCPERKAGCAVSCEKWRAYVKERNENYENRREEAENGTVPTKRLRATNRNLYRSKKNRG